MKWSIFCIQVCIWATRLQGVVDHIAGLVVNYGISNTIVLEIP